MVTQKLVIPTMKCGGCVSTIENALNALDDINRVFVVLDTKQVTIEGDIDLSIIIKTVSDSGFPVELV